MTKNQLISQAENDVDANVDALLAATNEISENEIYHTLDDPQRASTDGRGSYIWRELVEAFGLDIHDFSVNEVNH